MIASGLPRFPCITRQGVVKAPVSRHQPSADILTFFKQRIERIYISNRPLVPELPGEVSAIALPSITPF